MTLLIIARTRRRPFSFDGMTQALHRLAATDTSRVPRHDLLRLQTVGAQRGILESASTGWETFLDAVIRSGFAITGTWPMRTEGARQPDDRYRDTNALASSIVLVCRSRPAVDTVAATRREFLTTLRARSCQKRYACCKRATSRRSISPRPPSVPVWRIYTRYARVLDAEPASRCRCAPRWL